MADKTSKLTYSQTVKALIRLGFPVLVTQLGSILVGFADTLMIGRYGTDELASSAFVNNLFMVPFVMLIGFAGGVTPIVGALFGKGDKDGVGAAMRLAVRLNIAMSILLAAAMAVLFFFIDRLGQDSELLPIVRPYYILTVLSLPVAAVFFSSQQVSNGVNDTAMPMWVILGANLANVIGNYVLIYGHFGAPELGLAGAGISTLGARIAAAAVIWRYVARSRRFADYRNGYRRRLVGKTVSMRKLFNTSWPLMLQSGVECFLWAFGTVVCGWYGKHQLAGYQLVLTINQLGFMVYLSAATAVAIRVSNHTGVGDRDGVLAAAKAGLHINLVLCVAASLIFIIGGRELVEFFTDDPDVIMSAVALVLPLVLYQFGDAAQITFGNALRGTSNVRPMLWISIIAYLLIGIPVMLLLASGCRMESAGVYYSFSAAVFSAAYLYFVVFRRTAGKIKSLSD